MAGVKGMHDRTYKDPIFREKIAKLIRSSQIAQRLVVYVETGQGLDKDRAQIALGLLRKVVPDLSSTELSGTITHYAEALERIAKARNGSTIEHDAAPLLPDCLTIEQARDESMH